MTRFASATLGRRAFLVSSAAVGGGLMLGLALPPLADAAEGEGGEHGAQVTNWIIIKPDNTIIVRIARSEMGQGSFTALPMLVCEELECDWSKVKGEYASASDNFDNAFGSMATGGSRAIRDSQDRLRRAGAAAREMLLTAAAQKWGVPVSELKAENSVITHVPTGRTMTYGEIAEAASKLPPPSEVTLKDPKDWKLVGKAQMRFDIADKVMGRPVYGIDVRVPGMLYATLRQCPVFGGRLASYDAARIKAMPGVHQVVAMGNAVAVVAESYWQAHQALAVLPVTWDEGPNAALDDAAIAEMLRGGLEAQDAVVAGKAGDVTAALAGAAKRVEAEYHAPFLAHATMETMNCTAQVLPDGKVEVWAPTQNAQASLAAAAKAAGVDPKNVEVHVTMLGGGFGRRGAVQDFVQQAVVIAKAAGRPVKLIWSREEDMQHDFYRPVSMARLTAGLDAAGMPVAWRVRLTGQSILASLRPEAIKNGLDRNFVEGMAEVPYEFPNALVDYAMRNTPVPVGFWRSVNNSQNAFYKESFLDEVAHAGGHDPYELRRALLGNHPKERAVLDAAAKHAGWGTPLPAGIYRGIAYHDAYSSHVCGVAEIALDDKNRITLRRIVCAVDSGYVVNPDTVVTQIEGAIVYGLTAALYDKITIRNGRVQQANFDTYPMLRLKSMPRIEVIQMPSGGFWGGVGEVGLPPVAPAICNAIFAATGRRIRSLPLSDHGFTTA